MRKVLLTIAASVLAASSASAADLAARPYTKAPPIVAASYYNWTGFYAGLNAGWGSIHDNGDPYCIDPGGVFNGSGCLTSTVPGAHLRGSGFIGGGQVGYNWQSSHFVYGLEADIQGADIKDSLSIPNVGNIVRYDTDASLKWFGTVRGRLGYAWDRVLVYGTGGFAYGGVDGHQNTVFSGIQYPSSFSTTKTGWVAGGGVEWAFSNNWSVRGEGLYYDLGSVSTDGVGIPPDGYRGGKKFEINGVIARAAINYKFGGPVVAKY